MTRCTTSGTWVQMYLDIESVDAFLKSNRVVTALSGA